MRRTLSPTEMKAALDKHQDLLLIDVRRKNDYAADNHSIAGALWRNPDDVAHWSSDLPKNREIVVYCVRGGCVSNTIVDHLQGKQLPARYIEGGIEAWKNAGGPTVAKK